MGLGYVYLIALVVLLFLEVHELPEFNFGDPFFLRVELFIGLAQVVARFAQRMPRPAFLFVGVSESLLRLSAAFELEQVGGAFVYTRR